jgi:hypothetical protein
VADSAFGHLSRLCEADRNGLRFLVPLRADTGWAARFDTDLPAGISALTDLPHVAERERHLPPQRRTRWRGLLTAFPTTDPKHRSHHDLRVAYIWPSEEATSVAEALLRCLIAGQAEAGPGACADQMAGMSSSNAVASRNSGAVSTESSS